IAMGRNMAIVVVDQDGTERAVHRVQYGSRLHVDEGDKVKRGQRIAEWDPYTRPMMTEVEGTIGFEDLVEGQSMSETLDESTESAKTRDITGGLPRVAELFEARRPKEAAIIAEASGTVRFGRDYKNKRRLTIEPNEKDVEPVEYLIPKGKHIHLQDGDVIEK